MAEQGFSYLFGAKAKQRAYREERKENETDEERSQRLQRNIEEEQNLQEYEAKLYGEEFRQARDDKYKTEDRGKGKAHRGISAHTAAYAASFEGLSSQEAMSILGEENNQTTKKLTPAQKKFYKARGVALQASIKRIINTNYNIIEVFNLEKPNILTYLENTDTIDINNPDYLFRDMLNIEFLKESKIIRDFLRRLKKRIISNLPNNKKEIKNKNINFKRFILFQFNKLFDTVIKENTQNAIDAQGIVDITDTALAARNPDGAAAAPDAAEALEPENDNWFSPEEKTAARAAYAALQVAEAARKAMTEAEKKAEDEAKKAEAEAKRIAFIKAIKDAGPITKAKEEAEAAEDAAETARLAAITEANRLKEAEAKKERAAKREEAQSEAAKKREEQREKIDAGKQAVAEAAKQAEANAAPYSFTMPTSLEDADLQIDKLIKESEPIKNKVLALKKFLKAEGSTKTMKNEVKSKSMELEDLSLKLNEMNAYYEKLTKAKENFEKTEKVKIPIVSLNSLNNSTRMSMLKDLELRTLEIDNELENYEVSNLNDLKKKNSGLAEKIYINLLKLKAINPKYAKMMFDFAADYVDEAKMKASINSKAKLGRELLDSEGFNRNNILSKRNSKKAATAAAASASTLASKPNTNSTFRLAHNNKYRPPARREESARQESVNNRRRRLNIEASEQAKRKKEQKEQKEQKEKEEAEIAQSRATAAAAAAANPSSFSSKLRLAPPSNKTLKNTPKLQILQKAKPKPKPETKLSWGDEMNEQNAKNAENAQLARFLQTEQNAKKAQQAKKNSKKAFFNTLK